jgi:hypothetical protein
LNIQIKLHGCIENAPEYIYIINNLLELLYNYCLALYCFDYLENIGFVYPAMTMIIIGHSLLYLDKVGAV